MIESVFIIFIAFSGFFLAAYLFHKKRRKHEPFICPLRANCSEVMQSNYSKFLGIPVEVLGLCYYAVLALVHGLVLMQESLRWLDVYLLIASSIALLFSLYLTAIQIVALRKFCTWCLLSASFCLAIFALSIAGSLEIVLPFLAGYQMSILGLHILVTGIGTGTATITTLFFYKFLKDGRLSEDETGVLSTLFEFGWLSLCLLLISGSAFYLSLSEGLFSSSLWMLELIAVSVVIIISGFLTLRVMPRLVKISSGQEHEHLAGELLRARKIVFTLGPIALLSWYVAFVFGSLSDRLPFSFQQLLSTYVLLLLVAFLIGRMAYHRVVSRPEKII